MSEYTKYKNFIKLQLRSENECIHRDIFIKHNPEHYKFLSIDGKTKNIEYRNSFYKDGRKLYIL